MVNSQKHHHSLRRLNVHWPVWVALLAVALLYGALPKELYWGTRGVMLGVVSVLLIPMIVTQWRDHARTSRVLHLFVISLMTLYMVISVSRVVYAVLNGVIGPGHLLIASMALWSTNILVFALWYWNLDAGGPNKRELMEGSWFGAFLFPQMGIALTHAKHLPGAVTNWHPLFVDYLFLAFNASTAFSPTDTAVLSRWAKIMSMMQALISLTILVMLAARAINIITPAAKYVVS